MHCARWMNHAKSKPVTSPNARICKVARFSTGLVNEPLVVDIAGRVAGLMADVAAVVRGSVMTITSSSCDMTDDTTRRRVFRVLQRLISWSEKRER